MNNIIPVLGLIVFAATIVTVIFTTGAKAQKKKVAMYTNLATQRGGRVGKALGGRTGLFIPINDKELVIYNFGGGSKYSTPETILECNTNISTQVTMLLCPHNLVSEIIYKNNKQETYEINSDFDKEFVLKTDNIESVRNFMTLDIQKTLLSMKDLGVELFLEEQKFVFKIKKTIFAEQEMNDFMDTGVLVFEAACKSSIIS